MNRHFNEVENELREGLLNKTLVEDDIKKAADLARQTSKADHRILYVQVKNAVQTKNEETKTYTFDELVKEVDKRLKEFNQENSKGDAE